MHEVCLLLNKTVLSPPWRPTSSPGLFPGRDLFPPLPIFKGKALGTRLRGCPGGWGREEGKQKARGARWERDWKGRRRAYSLFPSCPAGFLFFDVLLFLLGYSVEVSAEERENGLYRYANIYVFFFIFVGCLSPLGMKSRFIKDGQISASSSMSDLQLPSAGRLHNTA